MKKKSYSELQEEANKALNELFVVIGKEFGIYKFLDWLSSKLNKWGIFR